MWLSMRQVHNLRYPYSCFNGFCFIDQLLRGQVATCPRNRLTKRTLKLTQHKKYNRCPSLLLPTRQLPPSWSVQRGWLTLLGSAPSMTTLSGMIKLGFISKIIFWVIRRNGRKMCSISKYKIMPWAGYHLDKLFSAYRHTLTKKFGANPSYRKAPNLCNRIAGKS